MQTYKNLAYSTEESMEIQLQVYNSRGQRSHYFLLPWLYYMVEH